MHPNNKAAGRKAMGCHPAAPFSQPRPCPVRALIRRLLESVLTRPAGPWSSMTDQPSSSQALTGGFRAFLANLNLSAGAAPSVVARVGSGRWIVGPIMGAVVRADGALALNALW